MRPKGSAEALEVRRCIAGQMLQQGKGIREVSRLVGAAPSSVCRWKRQLEQGGIEALRAKPHPGRPARLSVEQRDTLRAILLKGPQAMGFSTDLWTLARVAQMIEQEFGITYHPGHVWHILRDMGWSTQKRQNSVDKT